jgi:ElaB/YqjD/DUF883 family membrane-anchored ribosome-binding protein
MVIVAHDSSVLAVSQPVRRLIYVSFAVVCSALGLYWAQSYFKQPRKRIGRLRNSSKRDSLHKRSIDIKNWDQYLSKESQKNKGEDSEDSSVDATKAFNDFSSSDLDTTTNNQIHDIPRTRTSLIEQLSDLPFYDDTAMYLSVSETTSLTISSNELPSAPLPSDATTREIFSNLLQLYANGGDTIQHLSTYHRSKTIISPRVSLSNTSITESTSSHSINNDTDALSESLLCTDSDEASSSTLNARENMEKLLKTVQEKRRKRRIKQHSSSSKCSSKLHDSLHDTSFFSPLSSTSSSTASTPGFEYQSSEETEDFSEEEDHDF